MEKHEEWPMCLNLEKFSKYKLTPDAAAVFDWLIVKQVCFKGEPFFYQFRRIEEELRIRKDRFKVIVGKFCSKGFLTVEAKGEVKARAKVNYFYVDFNMVIKCLADIIDKDNDPEYFKYYKGWLMEHSNFQEGISNVNILGDSDLSSSPDALPKNAGEEDPNNFHKTGIFDDDSTCQKFIEYFNGVMSKARAFISPIKTISKHRRQMLNARYREHGIEAIREVVDNAAQSSFLNGGGDKAFTATFDWIFKPNNFVKIWEGNYGNNANTTKPGGFRSKLPPKPGYGLREPDGCRHPKLPPNDLGCGLVEDGDVPF